MESDQADPETILRHSRNVAVVGASVSRGRPAYYVPEYLARAGYRIFPVNPNHLGESGWGQPFRANLGELPEAIDVVNVFRRSSEVPKHVPDILGMRPLPRAVWLQLGIRNDEAASRLRAAGIEVVQDLCMLIEHRALD